jgi:hypothetical protein
MRERSRFCVDLFVAQQRGPRRMARQRFTRAADAGEFVRALRAQLGPGELIVVSRIPREPST